VKAFFSESNGSYVLVWKVHPNPISTGKADKQDKWVKC